MIVIETAVRVYQKHGLLWFVVRVLVDRFFSGCHCSSDCDFICNSFVCTKCLLVVIVIVMVVLSIFDGDCDFVFADHYSI